jgi:hypothetical protein
MEITGKILTVLPVQSGKTSKGEWKKQEFVLETPGQYPKKVCVSIFGEEALKSINLKAGATVTATVDIESREYNGRWYTNVNAWKVKETSPSTTEEVEDDGSDLPF